VRTVLVVDDEVELRDLVELQLTHAGFSVCKSSNGQEALEHIKKSNEGFAPQIDAILCDINMPIMDGLALLSTVRGLGIQTPFVFLTGYADKAATIQALQLGAFDFLEKPCQIQMMLTSVQKAAQVGVALRDLDVQLNKLCDNIQLPKDELELYRKKQKVLLLLRAQNQHKMKAHG